MIPETRRTALSVLVICFVLGLAGRGLNETFLVFLLPLAQGFGWERAAVASIYSVAMLANGVSGPLVGRLFDRSGPRTVYALGLLLVGGGLSLAPYADALWQFQLCLGLGVGIGTACLGNVPNSALISRWFKGRLTQAMSVVYSAFGIGILTLVPLAQLLNEALGWRGAYQWLGAAVLVGTAPVLALPWQRIAAGRPELAPRAAGAALDADAWTIGRALRHPAFWGLFAVFWFTSVAMFTVVVQVVAYLIDAGFPPLQAATAWGFSGILLPLGMITTGWLDGVIGRRPSVLLSYALTVTGMVLLWILGRYPNVWLLGAFVICFGGTLGSRGPLISAIAMRLFRGGHTATIFGMITVGSGLGAGLGSFMSGLLHDWTGGYDAGIAFAIINILGGVLPFLTVRALRH
ncbi:MAG: MFS transporter [Alphaproteobacteria bacterium]|nr:MFS transporter [Alphaproteobacteria bacterium]